MRRDHDRRLTRLESVIPRDDLGVIDPKAQERAWLKILSIEDLEFMADVAEHINADGSMDDLSAADQERVTAIMATRETFERNNDE